MEGLGGLNGLTFLDLSFNKIKRVASMGTLHALISLNLSYNVLSKLEDVSLIKQQRLGRLEVLDVRGNPVCEARNYRTKALQYLPDLCSLDGQRVRDTERSSAADKGKPLSFAHVAEASQAIGLEVVWDGGDDSGAGDDAGGVGGGGQAAGGAAAAAQAEAAPEWAELVHTLSVNYEHLTSVKVAEQLPNLRKASFAHNELSDVDDVAPCLGLEELSVEDNHITK